MFNRKIVADDGTIVRQWTNNDKEESIQEDWMEKNVKPGQILRLIHIADDGTEFPMTERRGCVTTIIIITRHAGLVEWLYQRGIVGKVISHATDNDVRGNHIVGAVPFHLAALAEKVTVVDMPLLQPEQRGQDLTPQQMDEAGACLKTYRVYSVNNQ